MYRHLPSRVVWHTETVRSRLRTRLHELLKMSDTILCFQATRPPPTSSIVLLLSCIFRLTYNHLCALFPHPLILDYLFVMFVVCLFIFQPLLLVGCMNVSITFNITKAVFGESFLLFKACEQIAYNVIFS